MIHFPVTINTPESFKNRPGIHAVKLKLETNSQVDENLIYSGERIEEPTNSRGCERNHHAVQTVAKEWQKRKQTC